MIRTGALFSFAALAAPGAAAQQDVYARPVEAFRMNAWVDPDCAREDPFWTKYLALVQQQAVKGEMPDYYLSRYALEIKGCPLGKVVACIGSQNLALESCLTHIHVEFMHMISSRWPILAFMDMEQMRRLNDMGALMEQRLPGLPDHHVLLINRRHPLVEGLLKLKSGSVLVGSGESSPTEQLAKELSRHLYDMARLGVGGLEPNELAGFQTRSSELMGALMQRAL